MSEIKKIQLTDEQIKDIKELNHTAEEDLVKLISKLMFELLEEQKKREHKFWEGMYLLAGVAPETHLLTVNYVDKCLYIEPRKE